MFDLSSPHSTVDHKQSGKGDDKRKCCSFVHDKEQLRKSHFGRLGAFSSSGWSVDQRVAWRQCAAHGGKLISNIASDWVAGVVGKLPMHCDYILGGI